jgi:hypothetical protein
LRQVLSRKLRLQATYTDQPFLTNQSVQSILPTDISWEWLLAVLNSRLLSWFFVKYNAAARRDDFPKIIIKQTRELPIPEPTNDAKLARAVTTMLSLQKTLAAETLPPRRERIEREIDATDRRIDRLVYELYGLSAQEIAIVEESAEVKT